LTSFLGGLAGYSLLLVPPTTVVIVVVSTTSSALLTVLTDEDWTAVKLRILKLSDGTLCLMCLLIENNTTPLGTVVTRLKNVGLSKVGWKRIYSVS